jgi:protein TIF31
LLEYICKVLSKAKHYSRRVIHKVLCDFGDAAFKASKAIHEGHISPMNPNEQVRSHVYLHNSIFISRAVDAGVETFKMSQGDNAARKAASRDANCMAMLHRLDAPKIYTLATVLIDYLGTRYVCQSIVPGILQGEKTHSLVYGAVESSATLAWEQEMHDLLEDCLGKHAMCATRVQPTQPLTDERLKEIEALRTEPPLERQKPREELTTKVCGPIEGKGIKGSDQRCYVLDLTRLTPRDANWVPKSMGGTGKWEEVLKGKGISSNLDDDEYITAILRQELVTQLTHKKMSDHFKKNEDAKDKELKDDEKLSESDQKQAHEEKSDDKLSEGGHKEEIEEKNDKTVNNMTTTITETDTQNEVNESKALSMKNSLSAEEEEYMRSLRYNVNVFLPTLRSLEGIDDIAVKQLKADEEHAREAAVHLWDVILPKITQDIKQGDSHQLPLDGKSMVELLHQYGVNCRYMGRLAALAIDEEAKDKEEISSFQAGKLKTVSRKAMPLSWLELLEVEMIARSSKHVLDGYLNEDGIQTLQVIASFMSCLISEGEESAGDTEKRMKKVNGNVFTPEEEDFHALSLHGSVAIRGRNEVWRDIENDLARRFRYKLTLYNCGKSSGRTSYPTLLRRFCQKTGVRLFAKNYDLGGKCLCASKGRLTSSYPISPLDIYDVVPLMKHAGAIPGEGFVPCNSGIGLPALHIMLPDARATFEAAHFSYGARALHQALELAQEATALYQRVVDGPLHLNIARCLDLTAAILFEAGETGLAAANAARSLGLTIQLGGFDCAEAMTGHSTLSHVLLSSQQVDSGISHLSAAAYLMELLAGPRYVELANCYYKMGSFYQTDNTDVAVEYLKCAQNQPHTDRLAEGMMAKGAGLLYAKLELYRAAVDAEKKAYQLYSMLLGESHELTLNSQKSLQAYTKLAVEQGTKKVEEDKFRKEEEAAEAMASQIEAEEAKAQEKKKMKGKKKN